MEKEIEIINRIADEAIRHGADGGGSYENNLDGLMKSMNDWLEYKNLSDQYEVDENDMWPQIIKKKNM